MSLVRRTMTVDKSTSMQIMVAWRDTKWVVMRDTALAGAYAYRTHAMDMARKLTGEAHAMGMDCYMLLRDRDGSWTERPCPRPPKDPS